MRAPNQYQDSEQPGGGCRRLFVIRWPSRKGMLFRKVFLQNEAIMSFRINKSNGFVLGLIGFVWLKSHCKANRGH